MPAWNRLEKILFGAFLFWSVAGLVFTFGHFTRAAVAHWPAPLGLRDFVDLCLRTGDPILILLAFANTHFHAARQWTAPVARRWALAVCAIALGVETLGTLTGFPFGHYEYTSTFGPLIGYVPLTIPLAWHVVVTNALFIVRGLAPYLPRIAESVAVGVITTAYDFILEPFATRVKFYWVWEGGTIPLQNYLAWFAVSALLAGFLAPTVATRFRRDSRPWLILGITLLIFAAGEFSR